MTAKKFTILIIEEVDALRGLAQSTLLKNCTNINVVMAAGRKEMKKKLDTVSPDLLIISEDIELGSKKLLKWLGTHPILRERLYDCAKTDRLERLIPPDHLITPFSLSGIHFWAVVATKEGEKRCLERYDVQDSVSLLAGKIRIQGSLINIAGGGILGLFPRDKNCPPIAEKVLLDHGSKGKFILAGVTGFPVRIQTERPEFKCATIQIAVKFNPLTEKQASRLKKYIKALAKK